MLVSHQYKFIFLKPGKTAGTSVEVFLEPLCAAPGHVSAHVTPTMESRFGIIGERASDPDRSGFYNHILPFELKPKLGDEVWNSYTKVATVRNPFDRVVSAFHHFKLALEKNGALSRDEVIRKFREWIAEYNIKSLQISSYAQIDGEPCLDFLIRYETLEDDVRSLLKRLGVLRSSLGDVPRLKTEFRKGDIPLTDYFDEETRQRVVDSMVKDFELLGYSDQVEDAEAARCRPQVPSRTDLELSVFTELAVATGSRTVGGVWTSEDLGALQTLLTRSFRMVRREKDRNF